MNSDSVKDIIDTVYNRYSEIVSCIDVGNKLSYNDIALHIINFVDNAVDIYKALYRANNHGWYPYTFSINLHEYGDYNFINIIADITEMNMDDNDNIEINSIDFSLEYNDSNIPTFDGQLGSYDDDDIDEMFGNFEDEDDDKPWLK